MKYSIGIDLGGTFIKFGAVGEDGGILRKAKIPTPQGCGYGETVDAIAGRIGALAAEMGAPCAVGVGCPGVIDGARGFVVTGGNLLWENKPFAGDLSRTAGVPVCVCNRERRRVRRVCLRRGEALFKHGLADARHGRGQRDRIRRQTLYGGMRRGCGDRTYGAARRRRTLFVRQARLLRGVRLRFGAHQKDAGGNDLSSREQDVGIVPRQRRLRRRAHGV